MRVHAADGIKPYGNGRLFGWIQLERVGWTTGAVGIDSTGRYQFTAPLGSFIRIQVAGDYQPCAVGADVRGDLLRDVRVVSDVRQLGAHLPAELLSDTPTLSGVVVEMTSEGRRPLSDVRVELDGLGGVGLVTATTLTDATGRYVLCGLGGESSTYLFASKAGFKLFEHNVPLSGSTTFDIELQR